MLLQTHALQRDPDPLLVVPVNVPIDRIHKISMLQPTQLLPKNISTFVLRKAQERVLLLPRLKQRDNISVHRRTRPLHTLLPRREGEGVTGMAQPNGLQEESRSSESSVAPCQAHRKDGLRVQEYRQSHCPCYAEVLEPTHLTAGKCIIPTHGNRRPFVI